jgi:hypothetical protein
MFDQLAMPPPPCTEDEVDLLLAVSGEADEDEGSEEFDEEDGELSLLLCAVPCCVSVVLLGAVEIGVAVADPPLLAPQPPPP